MEIDCGQSVPDSTADPVDSADSTETSHTSHHSLGVSVEFLEDFVQRLNTTFPDGLKSFTLILSALILFRTKSKVLLYRHLK